MLNFTLRIQEVKNKSKKSKPTDKPASFVKLPPPILAKTSKEIKFVHSDQAGIIIVTNKVSSSLNLQTIKKYVKNSNYINTKKVKVPCLPQSKLYLKIIGILL